MNTLEYNIDPANVIETITRYYHCYDIDNDPHSLTRTNRRKWYKSVFNVVYFLHRHLSMDIDEIHKHIPRAEKKEIEWILTKSEAPTMYFHFLSNMTCKDSENLSNDEKILIIKLNEKLWSMQEKISCEMTSKYKELNARIDDNDVIDDYEIEVDIQYYLKDDSVLYDSGKDDDALFLQQKDIAHLNPRYKNRDGLKLTESIFGEGYDGPGYCCAGCELGPIFDGGNITVCRILHDLVEHQQVKAGQLLEIGSIYFDIKVIHQFSLEL